MRKRSISGIWWVALIIVLILGAAFARYRLQDCAEVVRNPRLDLDIWIAKQMCAQSGNYQQRGRSE